MTVLTSIIDWFAALNPRIWQAIIAGAFVAGGWLFNGRQNRRAALRLRDEKLRDAHRAIFAEIATNLSNLWDEQTLRDYGTNMVEQMEDDPDFIPLIPRERNDRLFESIQGSIHILPRVTIDPIVMYYAQLDVIAAHVDDMRGEAFKALPQDRRVNMYMDYIEMRIQALTYGRIANYLIDIYAKSGKEKAEQEATRLRSSIQGFSLNSPTVDRSDP